MMRFWRRRSDRDAWRAALLHSAPRCLVPARHARVAKARALQAQRFAGDGIFCNAHMRPRDLRKHCALSDDVRKFLSGAIDQLGLSARAFDRVVKLSRTIADLDDAAIITTSHVAEAIQYRGLDRKLWQ